MRWIDRGPEPSDVRRYDRRFTQGWIRYFRDGVGERPKDSNWRGDAGQAAVLHGELCCREDSTPNDQVRLAMAQFRCGERDAALKTVVNIDVSELGGDSEALMKLAQMKRFLGSDDYIQDAYLSRRYGLNDPNAHLGFV